MTQCCLEGKWTIWPLDWPERKVLLAIGMTCHFATLHPERRYMSENDDVQRQTMSSIPISSHVTQSVRSLQIDKAVSQSNSVCQFVCLFCSRPLQQCIITLCESTSSSSNLWPQTTTLLSRVLGPLDGLSLFCLSVSRTSPLGNTTSTLNLPVKQKVAWWLCFAQTLWFMVMRLVWCCIIDWLKWSGISFAPPVVQHSMHSTALFNRRYSLARDWHCSASWSQLSPAVFSLSFDYTHYYSSSVISIKPDVLLLGNEAKCVTWSVLYRCYQPCLVLLFWPMVFLFFSVYCFVSYCQPFSVTAVNVYVK